MVLTKMLKVICVATIIFSELCLKYRPLFTDKVPHSGGAGFLLLYRLQWLQCLEVSLTRGLEGRQRQLWQLVLSSERNSRIMVAP